MPCYSLYLTNQPVTAHPTNPIKVVSYLGGSTPSINTVNTRVSATWNIDFDGLFKGEQNNYRKCRVRVKTMASLASGLAFETNLLSLNCSLSSSFNAPLSYDKSLLGLSYSENSPIGTSLSNVNANTMESVGVNINIPTGLQYFTLSYGSTTNPFNRPAIGGDFLIDFMLVFELYDPI